jgi:NSS family neurotransmitter:Na+ symporter
MAEMTLGRMSGRGTLDAFRLSFGRRTGSFLGYLLLVVITISGSYYAVVVSNVFFTALYSLLYGFDMNSISNYNRHLNDGWFQYSITVMVIATSLYIIHKGLTRGIEYFSKLVMPVFFLALTYMIFHALLLPDAISKFQQFLLPDLSLLGASEIFAAMGQAFFSVGLGGTFVIVYSGYFKSSENIPVVASLTGLGDATASFMFSLFLVPSVLVFGLDLAAGPKLIFFTLPQLFMNMPGGRWVGSLFLLFIFTVAFLSLMAAYQVPFTTVQQERPSINKKKILLVIGLLQCILALPSSLFPDIIAVLDLVFGSGMQVLGSALCILGLTWGAGKAKTILHMFQSPAISSFTSILYVWIKWIIPLALLVVLLGYIYGVVN